MAYAVSEAMTATIANGEAVSNALPVHMRHVVGIQMPADWTAASLTFQGSADGQTYYNLYDPFGAEVTVQAADDRFIMIPPAGLGGMIYLKVRSGTSGTPVNQGAERALKVMVRSFA